MIEPETLKKAIKTYGKKAQIQMAIEEMAELTQVLCRISRKDRDVTIDELSTEIADVEIMLEQLKFMFNNRENVDHYITYKVSRLSCRLEKLEKGEK